jgi:hypothetical protein
MKKTYIFLSSFIVVLSLLICSAQSSAFTENIIGINNFSFSKEQPRKKGKKAKSRFIRGPKGGCYYKNRNGKKTYVSRSLCR